MLRRLVRAYYHFRQYLLLELLPGRKVRRKGVSLGAGNRFWGLPIVSVAAQSEIKIGTAGVFCSRSDKTALGVNHPIVLRTLRPGACLKIGDGAQMSGTTVCCADKVTIGRRVFFGSNVTVCDTDFHALEPSVRNSACDAARAKVSPVLIGDDVFIGMNAVILKGVEIGAGAVIGAGSVVARSVAERTIVAGNPARVVGHVK